MKGLRAQAEQLNAMAKMNEIVLQLEQQASYARTGKPHRPVCDDIDCVSQPGSSVVNHEAKRAISNTMTWMDQIDSEVNFSFVPLGLTSFTNFR